MRPCLNQVTTLLSGTLEDDLKRCREVGFRDIELREEKYFDYLRRGHSNADLKAAYAEYGIRPVCFNAQHGFSFRHGQDMKTVRKLCEMLCAALSEIGIPNLELIAAADATNASYQEIHDETVRSLQILSEIADAYGIRLALEYIGLPANTVKTFNQTMEIIQDTGKDNVGILLDTWHHYMGGSTVEDILKAGSADRIFVVHISDITEHAPLTAARTECIFPGDGNIPLTEQLKALKVIGYDDFVSVEVFDMDIRKAPHEETVRKAYRSTCDALRAAGVLDAGY